MDKNIWIFDLEILRNFFSGTFLNANDPEEIKTFIICWDLKIDEKEKLKSFIDINVDTLVGYNSILYDSPILDYILHYNGQNLNKNLFDLSQNIINSDRRDGYARDKLVPWGQLDLMKIMAFDKLGVSLKQCAINLKWHKIQDLPLSFDYNVNTKEEIETIIKYNINDVLISYELFKKLQPEIEFRKELSTLYDVDLRNASDSKIANLLLEKFYINENVDVNSIKYLRTKRNFFWLRECIAKNIKFKTTKLKDLKFEIANTLVVAENNFAYKKKIRFANCDYELGIGGLHSDDKPGRFVSDENYKIISADVSSFYPYIIINNKIIPKHLDETFIDILKKITKERLDAKKNNEKVKADGLKITINSIFGKLGSDTFWLQDAKALCSVTVSGQLYLLMLIEALTLNGIVVISVNTDGIDCKLDRSLEEKYHEICDWWQKETNFILEFTEYDLFVKSDVNNYLGRDIFGKIKEKGRFIKDIEIKKGYHYPIVPLALYNYFVNNIDIEKTLYECNNILDFCLSQKAGKNFYFELKEPEVTTKLQKTNRFFISNNGGKLVKIDSQKNTEIGLYVDRKITIINNYNNNISINNYDIDYNFYKEEILKYIKEIEENEFSLVLEKEEESTTEEYGEELDFDNLDTSKIVIKNPKFRYSKAAYFFDKETNSIYRGIASIKFITSLVAKELQKISNEYFASFVDLLVSVEENCNINSKQMDILIRLNFFSEFGNNKKLQEIYEEFAKGENKYTKKLKDNTKNKRISKLKEFENIIKNKKINILEQINFELNLLGYIFTLFDIDKLYIYVNSIDEKYSPKLFVTCLATGKQMMLKVQKKLFDNNYMVPGEIIKCLNFEHKKAVRFVNGEFMEDDNKEKVWWLTNWHVLSGLEVENLLQD